MAGPPPPRSRTLAGLGLHTGATASVTISGGRDGQGLILRRRGAPPLPLGQPNLVTSTDRRTVLGQGPTSLSTTEHLLGAVAGTGRWQAEIIVDGPELPILDGSAAPYAEALVELVEPRAPEPVRLGRDIDLRLGPSRARARPCDQLVIECILEFDHPNIGRQQVRWDGDPDTFRRDFAPARTFGFVDELEALRQRGLIAGGSLESALVFDRRGPINSPRFPDEPARHKLVDALGDLATLGRPLQAELHLVRPGHALLAALIRQLI